MILGSRPALWLMRRCTRRVVLAALCAIPAVPVAETLNLTKSGPSTAREGDLIEYRLEVVNQGTASVAGVQVLDTLPDAVEFVQAVSTPAGLFDPATGIWSLPPLGTGAEDGAAGLRLQALVRSGLLVFFFRLICSLAWPTGGGHSRTSPKTVTMCAATPRC